MPASFKNTQENRIDDPTGSLNAFWESLQRLDRPVRIVHIGDSHVRGHVFPYIMRKALEADFGSEAVVDQPVTYRSSGLAQETGVSGIVYHIMGINGATCASFSTPENLHAVAGLDPDLIIVSFGTNEAHGRNYSAEEHRRQLTSFFTELKNPLSACCFSADHSSGSLYAQRKTGKKPSTPVLPVWWKRRNVLPQTTGWHSGIFMTLPEDRNGLAATGRLLICSSVTGFISRKRVMFCKDYYYMKHL